MDKVFEELDKIIKPKPSLGFEISNDPATVYDSKLGGMPYFPKNEDYPISSVNGEPLSLLVQINFSSIPNIEGFPKEGILQIFITNYAILIFQIFFIVGIAVKGGNTYGFTRCFRGS